jgi:hypothetical protein
MAANMSGRLYLFHNQKIQSINSLRGIGWEGVDWMHLVHDSDQWWALVNTVINLQVPLKAGHFLTS